MATPLAAVWIENMSDFDALLKENDELVVAFSGGLDSTVLLHQLQAWQQNHPRSRLRALHVHHGLSPNADRWAAHCLNICAQWQIPCEVLRVQVIEQGQGVEAAARQARYQALSQALCDEEKLLTAQHLDDQCETLLLALKRGSGPAGLAAMPTVTTLAGHPLLRPLLNHSRQILEQYAEAHQLVWVEDESNQDRRYDRNFLRQQLLPSVMSRWPHFAEAAARSAALCGEQEKLLDELLAEPLNELIQSDGSLCFTPLLTMSEVKGNALLRRWLAGQGERMPSREALRLIRRDVMLCRDDAQPRLKLGNHEIRRYRQQLYRLPLRASLTDCEIVWSDVNQPLLLPQNLGVLTSEKSMSTLRCPQPQEQVFVRFYATGYVHIVNRTGGREIKKIWQMLNIPPWQRERIPLIYFNQTLICAPGLFVTREGASQDAEGWQVNWQKTPEET